MKQTSLGRLLDNSIRAAALQITVAVALLSTSAVLLASSLTPQSRAADHAQVAATAGSLGPNGGMTFTVTSTADTDGSTCGTGCTLRQAVNASNANPPSAGTTNLIAFHIPSNDPGCNPTTHVCTITLTDCFGRSGNFCSGLSQPVIIDGYTQPGASPNTLAIGDNAVVLIKIIGDSTGDRVIQLCSPTACTLPGDSSGSSIKGLCLAGIVNTHQTLVFVGSKNDVVEGNFLGVDPDGMTVVSDGTPVQVGNGGSFLATSSIIGGTSPNARNVIVSNGGFALILNDGNTTLVQGNYLGTNAAGTAPLGSLATGIDLEQGSGNTIGGTASGAGNVINATGNGISVGGVCANCLFDTTIQGNLIGTDATGTVALQALNNGIVCASASSTIGGSTPGATNVITARADGIVIGGNQTNVVIQGNKIGADITGTMPLGNGSCGIVAGDTTTGTIGGLNRGEGNIIAFNALNGVSIAGFAGDNTSWSILGNSIHDNGNLGITLATSSCGNNSPTPNDDCDTDDGANNLQNYPVLTSVTNNGGNTRIAGTLNSTPNTTFRIEFFANDKVDPSGFGEGKTFVDVTRVTTDNNCSASFNVSVPQITGEPHITATATDPNGNTSEFSAAIGQLLNISTRLKVLTGDNVLIGGFIITGSDNKRVIVRGIGPSLTSQGVPGALQDPTLELHDGSGTLIASNDNWKDTQRAEIEATGIPPTDDRESAIVRTLSPGAYTAILRGKNNTTGVGLVEAYDLNQTVNSKLANISTRGFVDTGDNVMIGGFIAGNGLTKVIVRGLGPSLTSRGVPGALQDPTLELHDGSGTLIASNDNWKDTQQAEIRATGIPPTDDRESAIVTTLSPGPYTAIVRGKNNTTGVGLVEVYNIP